MEAGASHVKEKAQVPGLQMANWLSEASLQLDDLEVDCSTEKFDKRLKANNHRMGRSAVTALLTPYWTYGGCVYYPWTD